MEQISASGQPVTLLHFVREVSTSTGTEWRITCMPHMTEFHQTAYHPNYPRSDDPRAVTCPACKKTAAYREAKERIEAVLKGPIGAK